MKKVLVLGGTRFIGLHLVRSLHAHGYQVSILNRGLTGATLPSGVARLLADRSDSAQVVAALKNASFDAVFDLSGYVPAALKPVIEVLNGNVGRFVFCSTGAVYGPPDATIHIAPIPEDFPLDRSAEAGPYTSGKVECEDLLQEAFTLHGFPAIVLRPVYVYGPGNPSKTAEGSYFARLTQRRRVIIPGEGVALFHPVHVEDVVSAFIAALSAGRAPGQAYNIGGPEAVTANGYVETLGRIMGVVPEVVHVDMAAYGAALETLALAPDTRIYPYQLRVSRVCSIEKAKRELGWSPKFHLVDGLTMTYRWWLSQDKTQQTTAWDFTREDRILALLDRAAVNERL